MIKNSRIIPMSDKYQEYLIDESKYQGYADSISFPENEEQMIEIVKEMKSANIPITIQGGKTGIVGGGVPLGGHIMNLSRMNHCKGVEYSKDGTPLFKVEPGVNLEELNREINRSFKNEHMIWPPQPTETTASIGGIAASGAQGINAFYYGESKQYIEAIRMILSDGTVKVIERGRESRIINGKKTDLLDLVLGMEGTAGAFSELTLRLKIRPENMWGISFFFYEETEIGEFVRQLKQEKLKRDTAAVFALEYIDRETINMIEARKSMMSKLKELPDIETSFGGMIYLELQGEEAGIEELAECLMDMAAEAGSDPDKAWAVSGITEIEKMRAFRHAAAEVTNLFIEEVRRKDDRITKLGTDMAVHESDFFSALVNYKQDLRDKDLRGCVFGHVKENHLHVNILPENYDAYTRGKALVKEWAQRAGQRGEKLICEHGVGKLKKDILEGVPMDVLSLEKMKLLKAVKEELDPWNIWNRGNLFCN